MSIEDLPDHVLGTILSECVPNEWNRLEQVCPRWKRVMESHVGIILVRGAMTGIYVQPQIILNRFLLKDAYAASILVLKAIMDKESEEVKSEQAVEIVESKVPEPEPRAEFIRKLSFVGPIPLAVIGNIVNSCKTLFGVHFHFSTLSGVTDIDNLKLDVPTLKTLLIDTYGVKEEAETSGEDPDFIDFGQCFRVMVNILVQNNFHHLKKLILDVPFCEGAENSVVSAVSNFLSRHQTVQTFVYNQSFIAVSTKEDDKENGNDDDEEDEDEDDGLVSLRSLAANSMHLKNVSLQDIQIHLACPQESDPLWKNFILHQKRLRKLVYTGNSRIPLPTATIRENGQTLETIVLDVRDNVDLQAFADCPRLKKLVLMTNPRDEDDPGGIPTDAPNIKNFNHLPLSLEILSIRYLTIDRNDAEAIVSGRLLNLKKLELLDCGNENNFGVPIQMIGRIYDTKILQQFDIRCSLNRRSLTETSLPPSMALLAFVIDSNYSVTEFQIDGSLDAAKNYKASSLSPEDEAVIELGQSDIFTFPDDHYEGIDVREFGNESGDENDYETITDASSVDSSSSDGD